MRTITKLLAIFTLLVSAASCDDFFDLRPKNEMVLEDYWKSEDNVLSVTGACYRAMQEPGFMQRLIVWGEFRSDNVIKAYNTGDDINYIARLNLLPSNGYAYWGDFYNVINLCNTVEHFAPLVRNVDPNFTDGQLKAYIAEVKGIRAFCYFTLVRTFRDVPFITDPVIDDTKTFQIPQSDPDKVIDFLIEDLKSVEGQAITRWDNVAYTKGRMTQAAIRTLIADMCLWRGDYEGCVTYCDKVLEDKANPLTLENSKTYNRNLFVTGNSDESIFELQFTRSNIPNYTVCEFYGKSGGHSGWGHQQMAAYDFTTTSLFASTDLRAKDAFLPSSGSSAFPIKKYIAVRDVNQTGNPSERDYTTVDAGYSDWVIYRLPDIYLMKAEALTELGRNLDTAFDLVCLTYNRANPDAVGSLNQSDYNTQDKMRDLVFDERQREFLFEGKRYFDIIRRINRNRSQFKSIVNTYLVPKYADLDQSTVTSKLSDFDALYMPIKDTELKNNLELKQNQFYKVSSDITKN